MPKVAAGGRAQAGFLELVVEVDGPLGILEGELRWAVLEVEGDVADLMLLVELASALLAERADGLRDRRVPGIGLGDSLDRLLVPGIGELGAGRGPESDRDRGVGLVRELVAQQVAGHLAVGPRHREVVVSLLADAPGHTHDRE